MELKKPLHKNGTLISRRVNTHKGESATANCGIKVVLKSNVSEIEVTPERVECEIKVFNPPPLKGVGLYLYFTPSPEFLIFYEIFSLFMSWPFFLALIPLARKGVLSC